MFHDKKRCRPGTRCGRQDMIETYLDGISKLIVTVNINDDWVPFGKNMEVLVKRLMNYDKRRKDVEEE